MSAQNEDTQTSTAEETSVGDGGSGQQSASRGFDMIPIVVLVTSLVTSLGMVLVTSSVSAPQESIAVEELAETREPEVGETVEDEDDEFDDADYEYAEDVLGVYETRSTAGDESVRERNLQAVARAINGIIIEPGEDLSMNEVVGEVTAERGYEDVVGLEYATDAVDQMAGTLHIAALKAGLTVFERAAHMSPVEYMPLGMDAMVVWDMEDLVIHNGLGEAVTIQATASETTVTISILGVPDDPSQTRDVESQVVDTYTRIASEVYDDPLAQGLLSSDNIQFSVSETYLVTYRDNEEVSRELLYADTYQMLTPVSGDAG